MCGSDGNCQRSNTCALYEFFCFLRICVGVCLSLKVVLFTAYLTKLSLTWNVQGCCYVRNSLGLFDIVLKIQFGTVDHHRCVACMHCLHCKFKTAAVVKMKAYRNRSLGCLCCHDCCVSLNSTIFDRRWCCLDHNRCFQLLSCLDDCFHHFHILCVESSYRISALLCF